jgi:hypothetical protein
MSVRILTAAAVSALAIGLVAGPAAAQAAKFEGTVVAKNKQAKRFKLRQDEGGGTFRLKVNRATTYDRLAGFRALRVGMRNISVVAHRNAKGRWIATHVERSGKAGGGGGGADDGPNHT